RAEPGREVVARPGRVLAAAEDVVRARPDVAEHGAAGLGVEEGVREAELLAGGLVGVGGHCRHERRGRARAAGGRPDDAAARAAAVAVDDVAAPLRPGVEGDVGRLAALRPAALALAAADRERLA